MRISKTGPIGLLAAGLFALVLLTTTASARDLAEVKAAGVLRHLGIPYANFVTGSGDGLEVEIMQGFAGHLGVRYEFVPTAWQTAFGDLTGRDARNGPDGAEWLGTSDIRGDVIANGLTILPWRQQIIDYSDPTFPTGVWLLARAESHIAPISPSGRIEQDIVEVKRSMNGISVLAQESTCLDPSLYRLSETHAEIRLAGDEVRPDEFAPALLNEAADTTLLDVPDTLIALDKWPGRFKVIGPVSEDQFMGAGFRKTSPQLRMEFNRYFAMIKRNGTYRNLVEKYFPSAFHYYPAFFDE